MKKLNCGIYQIRNIVTGFCLAGQSMRLKIRPNEHWGTLRNNNHWNQYLQNSYNKHGKECFVFEILLYCEPEELTRYEQFFVNKYVALGLSYNICRECVDSPKGIIRSLETKRKMSRASKGRIHTPETIEKISKNHANVSGENNPMYKSCQQGKNNPFYGKTHTKESKKQMSETSLLDKEKVIQILQMLDEKKDVLEIIKKLGISRNTVYKAKRGYYHQFYDLPKYNFGKPKTKRLDKEKVILILKMLDKGMPIKNISKKIEVGITTVYRVKNGFYNKIYELRQKYDK